MKRTELNLKLVLNKKTIANLENSAMNIVRAGAVDPPPPTFICPLKTFTECYTDCCTSVCYDTAECSAECTHYVGCDV